MTPEVRNQIIADAAARHPGDYATQVYLIKRQMEAYEELQRLTAEAAEPAAEITDDPCVDGHKQYAEWQYDAQGIELCKTCEACHAFRMKQYRPEILTGYTQADVSEPIEAE